ncbi:MAG TPA: PQQ-binding-like beta-propeller repeat protein [Pseudomonadota bacterium]|nr:PQQ-binding-like beta-propeller repeat protein [Pseudomonadota bacterium]
MQRLIRLGLLPLVSVLGCAGLGLEPRPSSLGGVQVARETFVAPQAVVRVRWTRPLVHKQAFFAYNPQEFATAAVSPDGQTVFVGSSEKQLYALRYRDGEVLWQRPFKGGLASEPLYVPAGEAHPEPLLLVGDDDGSLTALAPATGEVRWTTQLSGPIRTLPTVSGGLVYTTTTSGRIYAHKLDTGKWVWQYERETPDGFAIRGGSGALVSGGRVYVGFPDGYLGCLRAENGEVLWTRQLSGNATRFTDVDSTPVLVGDTLYVSCYASGVFALDVKDGSTRWRYDLDAAGQLAADPQGERIYASSSTQGLVALDRKGRLLWQLSPSKQGEISAPQPWGRYVLFNAVSSGLLIVDGKTGELVQAFNPGQGASARPSTSAHEVYLLSNAGVFFALTHG